MLNELSRVITILGVTDAVKNNGVSAKLSGAESACILAKAIATPEIKQCKSRLLEIFAKVIILHLHF
jgi:hypothetical protein